MDFVSRKNSYCLPIIKAYCEKNKIDAPLGTYLDSLDMAFIDKNMSPATRQIAFRDLQELRDLSVVYGLGSPDNYYSDKLLKTLEKQYNQKSYKGYESIPVQKIHITYLTLVGGMMNKSFKTYDTTRAFNSQIKSNTFNGHTLGLEVNHYANTLSKHMLFESIGIVQRNDNNLTDLNTTNVTEYTTLASGKVTHQTGKQSSAYTEKVTTYNVWDLYANLYVLYMEVSFLTAFICIAIINSETMAKLF